MARNSKSHSSVFMFPMNTLFIPVVYFAGAQEEM